MDALGSAAIPLLLSFALVFIAWPTMLTYMNAERRGRDRTLWTFGAFASSILLPVIGGWIVFAGLMLLPEGAGPGKW